MEIPLRRNRGEFQRPPQGEFRAPAARKSDDTAEKVQPAGSPDGERAFALALEVRPVIGRTPLLGGEIGLQLCDACLECSDDVGDRPVISR
jgi:hypothetical protein